MDQMNQQSAFNFYCLVDHNLNLIYQNEKIEYRKNSICITSTESMSKYRLRFVFVK